MGSTTVRVDGAEVRRRRVARRLLQHEMATLTGVDQGYLSKVENGRRPLISVQTLRKIEACLGRLDEPDPEEPPATSPAGLS